MCYFYALFQPSKQFHPDIIINTVVECKNTFKQSTCLIYVLKASYDNSRRQRTIFYSYRIDMKNDKDRWLCTQTEFLLIMQKKGGQSSERRKSVPTLTTHCLTTFTVPKLLSVDR